MCFCGWLCQCWHVPCRHAGVLARLPSACSGEQAVSISLSVCKEFKFEFAPFMYESPRLLTLLPFVFGIPSPSLQCYHFVDCFTFLLGGSDVHWCNDGDCNRGIVEVDRACRPSKGFDTCLHPPWMESWCQWWIPDEPPIVTGLRPRGFWVSVSDTQAEALPCKQRFIIDCAWWAEATAPLPSVHR